MHLGRLGLLFLPVLLSTCEAEHQHVAQLYCHHLQRCDDVDETVSECFDEVVAELQHAYAFGDDCGDETVARYRCMTHLACDERGGCYDFYGTCPVP